MFKSCSSHVQVMFKSCSSHVQVMCKSCASHVQVMYKSCQFSNRLGDWTVFSLVKLITAFAIDADWTWCLYVVNGPLWVAGNSSSKKLGSSYFNKIHWMLSNLLKYQLSSFSHELFPVTTKVFFTQDLFWKTQVLSFFQHFWYLWQTHRAPFCFNIVLDLVQD